MINDCFSAFSRAGGFSFIRSSNASRAPFFFSADGSSFTNPISLKKREGFFLRPGAGDIKKPAFFLKMDVAFGNDFFDKGLRQFYLFFSFYSRESSVNQIDDKNIRKFESFRAVNR